jgi:hypothetical protein
VKDSAGQKLAFRRFAAGSLPRRQLRKDRAQDYRDYKQRIEIFLPCWPERAFGALTLGYNLATADHFQSPMVAF